MCRSRVYQEIRASSRVVGPDDEKRLELKRKPIGEPKLDEPTPETPQDLGNDADAAMDKEIHGKLVILATMSMTLTWTKEKTMTPLSLIARLMTLWPKRAMILK